MKSEEIDDRMQRAFRFGVPEDRLRAHQTPLLDHFAGCRTVLDIGCGRGVFLDLLRERGIQGEGVDIMLEAVEYCRSKGHVAYAGEAGEFLTDKVDRYDGILCSHVVEHEDFERAMHLVGLCFRALTPGGILVIVTPNARDLHVLGEVFWLDPTHKRPYPPELLTSMLETAGYTKIRTAAPLAGPARRRDWPAWLAHKLVLGRYFGNPDTIAIARKSSAPGSSDRDGR
jgi:2-polyprenyl-3-methyl-5-hydroxy-6-metoxy-1,4-benzoquinol methylase